MQLPAYAVAAVSGKLFLDAQNGFGTNGNLPARAPSVPYPGDADYTLKRLDGGNLSSSLSNQFKLIAQMLAAGLPTEVFFTRLGGWDTHSNQAVDHPNLMRALGGSIRAFYDYLASVQTADGNAQERVMILAWSEFGRRVAENKGGTDHGTAGLSFCVGRAVRGGFYGDYPDLSSLDAYVGNELVASGDVDALARALRRMIADADLRCRLSDAALVAARTLPTWQQSGASFATALEKLA